jgi:hypothetical protein
MIKIKQPHYFNSLIILIYNIYMGFNIKTSTNNNIVYSKFDTNNIPEVQEKEKKIKYDYETIKNIVMNSEERKSTKNNTQKQRKPIKTIN